MFPRELYDQLVAAREICDSACTDRESIERLFSSSPLWKRLPFRKMLDLFTSSPEIVQDVSPLWGHYLLWDGKKVVDRLDGKVDLFSIEDAQKVFDLFFQRDHNHPLAELLSCFGKERGLFLYVPPGQTISFEWIFSHCDLSFFQPKKVFLVVGAGAKVCLQERWCGTRASPSWGQCQMIVYGQERSVLLWERSWDRLGGPSSILTRIYLEQDSCCKVVSRGDPCTWLWCDYHGELLGAGAHLDIQAAHPLKAQKNTFSLTTNIHHKANKTVSNQLIKKALIEDHSQTLFGGKITIDRKAVGAEAYQLNRAVLLGKHVCAQSLPCLWIEQGDVKATHGSTASGLDEELLFFLASRGISRALAEELTITAFLNEVVSLF